jgi:hypothetical protein
VEFVSGAKSTPYTLQSGFSQQYFRIISPEISYLVKAKMSDGAHAHYPVDGFGDRPAVFRATEGEAVRIAAHRSLEPGGHMLVSRKQISGLHVALGARKLETIAGLHATFIQIPDNPNWQIRQNLKSLLGFDITTKIAAYGFLSPPNAYELAPDCWEVPRDTELALLIRVSREHGPRFTRLLVQHRLAGHLTTGSLPWDDDADEFVLQFKSGGGKPDLFRIGLTTSFGNPVWFLLEVNFSDEPVPPHCARIQFQFASATNVKTRLKWSAHELPKALIDAAHGAATLLAITNKPKAVEIAVSDSRGQRVGIPEESAAKKLLDYFRQASFPCVLSASGHPDIFLRRERRVVERRRELAAPLDLAPRCRQQARLLDAYRRGRVSEYAIRSIAL